MGTRLILKVHLVHIEMFLYSHSQSWAGAGRGVPLLVWRPITDNI